MRTPLVEAQVRRFTDLVGSASGAAVHELLSPGQGAETTEIRLPGNDGEAHFIVAAKPLMLGATDAFALTFTDVTERVRGEVAVQSERAARAVIASANEAVLVCDRGGVITHANAAAATVYDGDPVGQIFADAIPLIFPGATGLMQADDVVSMAITGTSLQGIEAIAPKAPRVKDYLVSAAPLQVGGDAISGCVVTMVDLSQRKAAEKQQLLLMRELDHRVKNTLALVMSIAGRTAKHEDTLDGFLESFTGRIHALAETHNLLAENSWADLTIGDVVSHELAPYTGGHAGRVRVEGLDIAVSPRAAIAFGLVIHELTTNAAKYGALSQEKGHIDVRLRETVRAEGDEIAKVVIEWRESDGPAVSVPARSGFGQTVIRRSLQYSANGGADLQYHPEGVICLISLPGEDLRPTA
jgi:two-component sensor histidine kinase/PAS domain-containing protein